mmetsp:Transcript_13565/g.39553  ORF Transcript_13565/g.39553 Transcript_13565/m.39553 type:complete len:143 (+) Transcript_13565:1149-1577(+)
MWGTADDYDKTKCNTSGRVSQIGFDDNLLGGSVPRDLALLSSSLEKLYFGNVGFSGSIPAELGILSNLRQLDLHGNRLSEKIPSELGLLSNLRRLWLRTNYLTGSMPEEICQLRPPNGKLGYLQADCVEEVQCSSECCTNCW